MAVEGMTVMYLYYNQPQAIKLFESIGYKNSHIKFLFIDDGSKEPLKLNWKNAHVLRIEKDIAWNQPQANNIGFEYIFCNNEHESVLRMDIDHYFTLEDLDNIGFYEPFGKEVVTFLREGRHPHPNIYLTSVKHILNAGGYNEEFCGNYGYDDLELMTRLKRKHFSFTELPIKVKINNSLKGHGLVRDSKVNKLKYLKTIEESNSQRSNGRL